MPPARGKEQAAPRARITANSYSGNPDLPFMVRSESDDSGRVVGKPETIPAADGHISA
ncbi:MAG: hypothetical protein WAQ52_18425 [Terriglobales bacterium]